MSARSAYLSCRVHCGLEIFDESLVQVASGQLVRLPEMTARFAVGDKGDVRLTRCFLNVICSQIF